jgi:hypothetical protein
MVISGGQDVLLSGNTVSDFPDGCGIECSAKWGPLSRFIISNNHVTNIGRSGILFRHGPDGTKSLADGLVCANNILANISGAPIDFLAYNIQESCNLLPPLQVES